MNDRTSTERPSVARGKTSLTASPVTRDYFEGMLKKTLRDLTSKARAFLAENKDVDFEAELSAVRLRIGPGPATTADWQLLAIKCCAAMASGLNEEGVQSMAAPMRRAGDELNRAVLTERQRSGRGVKDAPQIVWELLQKHARRRSTSFFELTPFAMFGLLYCSVLDDIQAHPPANNQAP